MKLFFFKITNTNQDKNKLYKEYREFVFTYDRSLIKGEKAFKQFLELLKAKIKVLNQDHKRCRPITLTTWSDARANTALQIQVENSWYATVYVVKDIIE